MFDILEPRMCGPKENCFSNAKALWGMGFDILCDNHSEIHYEGECVSICDKNFKPTKTYTHPKQEQELKQSCKILCYMR